MIDLVPAARRTGALIIAITREQLTKPTPCPRYRLGDLLDHVAGFAQAFTDAATKKARAVGGPAPSGDADRLEPDWRTSIPGRLLAMALAWRQPAAWEGLTTAGGIQIPGHIAGLIALNETIVHGWDIARATCRAYQVDPEQAKQCILAVTPRPGEHRPIGDDVPFGCPVEIAADAPPLDRLIAVTGRDPSWTADATAR